ncbi:DUF4123 domain-containing protein [Sulfuriferula nivalis]|uniref:DUF4123 domain-containing protein n=1 Tax=Sulfuriferula nivalis TaxID=2675298 RepID=A0A809RE29_9PROT|nr:DUF4123 domain-containing protein [Sulfuriferula nivalis]BBP00029.1 hypothetical protein SFSGTM_07370 [Sulfuriferula nivalis]
MYFANDYLGTLELLDHALPIITERPALNWIAVVDQAFDYQAAPLRWHSESVYLYDNDLMQQFAKLSPVLLPLPTDEPDRLRKVLISLFAHCEGRPMLSLIASEQSATEIAKAWRPYQKVKTDDGQSFILRLADTRVLPALAVALPPAAWHGLTHQFAAWYIINRSGDLENIPLAETDAEIPDEITLDAEAVAMMLDLGQPDAVIAALHEKMPDLAPDSQRAQFYQRITDICAYAKQYRVESFQDIVALAILACVTNNEAMTNPKLQQLLQQHKWKQGNLISELEVYVE